MTALRNLQRIAIKLADGGDDAHPLDR